MTQRMVPLLLIALLVAVQAQMWFGRGSVPSVAALQRALDQQSAANAQARLLNEQIASEIEDFKTGLGMVEEKARMELGMVGPNEIFVQVNSPQQAAPAPGNQ